MTADARAIAREWAEMLAVIETRAHLELLTAQGRLASSVRDGVVYYEVPPAP